MDSLQVWTGSAWPVVDGAVRMGDEELIAAVAGGDASAFEQLYDRYGRAVY